MFLMNFEESWAHQVIKDNKDKSKIKNELMQARKPFIQTGKYNAIPYFSLDLEECFKGLEPSQILDILATQDNKGDIFCRHILHYSHEKSIHSLLKLLLRLAEDPSCHANIVKCLTSVGNNLAPYIANAKNSHYSFPVNVNKTFVALLKKLASNPANNNSLIEILGNKTILTNLNYLQYLLSYHVLKSEPDIVYDVLETMELILSNSPRDELETNAIHLLYILSREYLDTSNNSDRIIYDQNLRSKKHGLRLINLLNHIVKCINFNDDNKELLMNLVYCNVPEAMVRRKNYQWNSVNSVLNAERQVREMEGYDEADELKASFIKCLLDAYKTADEKNKKEIIERIKKYYGKELGDYLQKVDLAREFGSDLVLSILETCKESQTPAVANPMLYQMANIYMGYKEDFFAAFHYLADIDISAYNSSNTQLIDVMLSYLLIFNKFLEQNNVVQAEECLKRAENCYAHYVYNNPEKTANDYDETLLPQAKQNLAEKKVALQNKSSNSELVSGSVQVSSSMTPSQNSQFLAELDKIIKQLTKRINKWDINPAMSSYREKRLVLQDLKEFLQELKNSSTAEQKINCIAKHTGATFTESQLSSLTLKTCIDSWLKKSNSRKFSLKADKTSAKLLASNSEILDRQRGFFYHSKKTKTSQAVDDIKKMASNIKLA